MSRVCHGTNREYVRMFLHPIGISLVESFYLVCNVWHVEIVIIS